MNNNGNETEIFSEYNSLITDSFKQINKKNSNLNNLINDKFKNYNIYNQIIIHHLISSIFINRINKKKEYIIKIMNLIIDKLNEKSNDCSYILLSSTIFFIIEQNYIHNRKNMNDFNSIKSSVIDIIKKISNQDKIYNLLDCIGEGDMNEMESRSGNEGRGRGENEGRGRG
jgi:hypothetical protein